jgi:hypothetical protein
MQTQLFDTSFSVGDKVRHKLTGQILSIKSISETVASCWLPEPFKNKFDSEVSICVCLIKNLELCNS